jgi:hypothetical protein
LGREWAVTRRAEGETPSGQPARCRRYFFLRRLPAIRHLLTTISKKFLQHLRRTSGQYSAPHFHPMIQSGVIHHLQNRMDGAGLRVVGAVHQAADARMNRRSRAHGARLNGGKQFAVAESVIPERSSRLAQSHDFRVSGRIAVGKVAIRSSPDNATFAHHDRSYRHFTGLEGTLGGAQGFFHPQFVG